MRTAQEDTLTSVISTARTTNGWQVRGVVYTGTDEGIVLFQHPAPADHYGTAAFDSKGRVPHFFWGHYDMSEQEALTDFAERTTKGR